MDTRASLVISRRRRRISAFWAISSLLQSIPTSAAYLNNLNQALLDRTQLSGEVFVSNAVISGRYVLRACIVNFNARESDIDAVPELIARLGRLLDAELRNGE